MSLRHRTWPVFGVVGGLLITACSDRSVVAPVSMEPARNPGGYVAAGATAVSGVYGLTFLTTGGQPVTSLTACDPSIPDSCEELILHAHVEDVTGSPAQSGSVTFQYCSYKGFPPNNIDRADEAPSAACADGSAQWARLLSLAVDNAGNASMNFGIVRTPRTVGFRFTFSGKRSGIASGASAPRDFTWVAP